MFRRAVAISVWSCLVAATAFAATPFREGVDYDRVARPQATSSPAGRVEVAEVFQYGCGGCAALEPRLEQWVAAKPDYVDFIRIPAVWNALGELHARAYYTAEVLGVLDKINAPMFNAIHAEGNHLETPAKLRAFFAQFGVDAKTFDATFESFAVQAKLARAKDLVTRYNIPETPSIVVDGRYLTRGKLAQGYDRWFEIVEGLAGEAHGP